MMETDSALGHFWPPRTEESFKNSQVAKFEAFFKSKTKHKWIDYMAAKISEVDYYHYCDNFARDNRHTINLKPDINTTKNPELGFSK